jgi:Lrp/AsnC family leucine-responsive transcriptional regulator
MLGAANARYRLLRTENGTSPGRLQHVPDSPDDIDRVDRRILDLLGDDARQSAESIAKDKEVHLSATAVRRRIARMEAARVIVGYTVVRDHRRFEDALEAYIELDFGVETDVQAFLKKWVKEPEVREASTLAGHPDAILRLRVKGLERLQEIVVEMRKSKEITSSKTLIAFDRVRHVSIPGDPGAPP